MIRLLQNLALLFASVLIPLLIFEAGLRLAGYRAIYEMYSKPSQFWQHDPLLGWSHEPGSRGVYVGPRPWPIEFETPIEINALGLRGPELGSRTADERRVLFLGDSMVAAFEVPYEETFVARIQAALAVEGMAVHTINAGVRGYGTDQSLLYLRERGRHLAPDVVVHLHSGNDARNNRTLHRVRRPFGKPAFVLQDDMLALEGSPVPVYPICSQVSMDESGQEERRDGAASTILCRMQMGLFDHSALLTYLTLRVPWDAGIMRQLYYLGMPSERVSSLRKEASPGRALTTRLIRELAHEARDAGARFVLASEQPEHRSLDLDELARDGIVLVDLRWLQDEDPVRHQFVNDSHYNPQGHQRAADRLLPFLRAALGMGEAGA